MTRLHDATLSRRLAAALIVAVAAMVSLVLLSTTLLLRVRSDQDAVTLLCYRAVMLSNQLFIEYVDAETAIRGYALTGNEDTLGPYTGLRSGISATEAKRVRILLRSDVGLVRAFDRVVVAADTWDREWAKPTIAAVQQGGGAAVTATAVAEGKVLFDAIRAAYATYKADVDTWRAEAVHRLNRETDLLFLATLAVVISVVLLLALAWFLLVRWVTNPLAALGREAKVVGEGDLEHEVRVDGPPDLRHVGSEVEAMRRRLVTALSEVESSRRQADDARQRLAEQAEDLRRSNSDLEQFAYVASHDLQEPLRKVASFCQLLERRYKGQLDERGETYIAYAVDGATRMQQLITDLLAFSRVGRGAVDLEVIDLDECTTRALRALATAIEETEAVVTVPELPQVRGQVNLLAQLLQNLVSNGIKFRRPGVTPEVTITCEQVDDTWLMACSDNGIGIEPQYAERIFVIFQRLHPKDEYAGTGIGLALCKRIVEFHDGRIWLDTSVSVGTTVRWTLPVVSPHRSDSAPRVALTPEPLQGATG